MGKDINHIEEKDELAVAQQQQRMTESYRETSRNLSGKHEQSEITPDQNQEKITTGSSLTYTNFLSKVHSVRWYNIAIPVALSFESNF